ncbi:MAG: Na+/H+ antiporter NhaA [Phycisphaerae bacterium]|nr:Na+/H+ antiporter NhaA [Phycisphaerae bacterium]MCZ2400479.1 Na+/H+ antiporter NhaA [Phycisphaerae bacterium]NUQ50007.1 Na+/H+ antiporter NhaA [Phycisphaerae bacterium]
MSRSEPPNDRLFPGRPIERLLAPVQRFLRVEASSGIVLVACTVLALLLANSPLGDEMEALWHLSCQIGIGQWVLAKDLHHVVNDGLMAIFFFVVGLEIKREMVAGELRNPRHAALPIVAALGGMLIPAALFVLLAWLLHLPATIHRGWAIPMATDIAFVVGVLALFGSRVPFSLKIMLLSLAIVDDLGAVLIIAFVFTEQISWAALALAAAGFGLTYGLNRVGVRNVPVYVLVGAGIWLAVLKSGVHPTVAGVMLGLLTPASAWIGNATLTEVVEDLMRRLRGGRGEGGRRDAGGHSDDDELHSALDRARLAMRESVSPLNRLEHGLHPWVAFVIMPVFALANAGVEINVSSATDPLAYAIAAGLLIGKPLGIVGFSYLAVKAGFAQLPTGTSWLMLIGGGCLAGIGFTMAIFLATLSLPANEIDAGKIGILGGSLLSTVAGAAILLFATRGRPAKA